MILGVQYAVRTCFEGHLPVSIFGSSRVHLWLCGLCKIMLQHSPFLSKHCVLLLLLFFSCACTGTSQRVVACAGTQRAVNASLLADYYALFVGLDDNSVRTVRATLEFEALAYFASASVHCAVCVLSWVNAPLSIIFYYGRCNDA